MDLIEAIMFTPVELREEAQRFKWEAKGESDIHLKRGLASHALALAQLAEKIERQERRRNDDSRHCQDNPSPQQPDARTIIPMTTRAFVATKNIQHYKRLLSTIADDSALTAIKQLLKEAEAELDASKAEDELVTIKSPIEQESVQRWRLRAAE